MLLTELQSVSLHRYTVHVRVCQFFTLSKAICHKALQVIEEIAYTLESLLNND